jgi:hypothetical protein
MRVGYFVFRGVFRRLGRCWWDGRYLVWLVPTLPWHGGEGTIRVIDVYDGVLELWLCVEQGWKVEGAVKEVSGVGHVSMHFFYRLPLVGVTIGLGFCASGEFVRCNEASRQYLNILTEWKIMEGLLKLCTHKIVINLGSVNAMYVGKPIWGKYARMCGSW